VKVLASLPQKRKLPKKLYKERAITHSLGSHPAAGFGREGRMGSAKLASGRATGHLSPLFCCPLNRAVERRRR